MVLDHKKKCVVVNEGSHYDTYMEQLVAMCPYVKLPRKKPFRDSKDIQRSTQEISDRHGTETDNITDVRPGNTLPQGHVDRGNHPIETEQGKHDKAERTVFGIAELGPVADSKTGGT